MRHVDSHSEVRLLCLDQKLMQTVLVMYTCFVVPLAFVRSSPVGRWSRGMPRKALILLDGSVILPSSVLHDSDQCGSV